MHPCIGAFVHHFCLHSTNRVDEEEDEQGSRGMDCSSITNPFGDQDSGGGSKGRGSGDQDAGSQHDSDQQSDRREQAEQDADDGQTWLFLKVTAEQSDDAADVTSVVGSLPHGMRTLHAAHGCWSDAWAAAACRSSCRTSSRSRP